MTVEAFFSAADTYRGTEQNGTRYTAVGGCLGLSHSKSIPIRLVSTPEELESLYQFRYQVYVEEMKRAQVYANHLTRRIEDPLDRGGYNFAAFQGDEVVGAVRVNFPRVSSIAYYESFLDMRWADRFRPSATSICTRLMVAPRLRRTSLAVRLAQVSYRFGLFNKIRYNFVDCDDCLTRFFAHLGYIFHQRAEHPEYGIGNVMRLDLLDRARLAQTRSPFLAILDEAVG